jgi:hypothetical protein
MAASATSAVAAWAAAPSPKRKTSMKVGHVLLDVPVPLDVPVLLDVPEAQEIRLIASP